MDTKLFQYGGLITFVMVMGPVACDVEDVDAAEFRAPASGPGYLPPTEPLAPLVVDRECLKPLFKAGMNILGRRICSAIHSANVGCYELFREKAQHCAEEEEPAACVEAACKAVHFTNPVHEAKKEAFCTGFDIGRAIRHCLFLPSELEQVDEDASTAYACGIIDDPDGNEQWTTCLAWARQCDDSNPTATCDRCCRNLQDESQRDFCINRCGYLSESQIKCGGGGPITGGGDPQPSYCVPDVAGGLCEDAFPRPSSWQDPDLFHCESCCLRAASDDDDARRQCYSDCQEVFSDEIALERGDATRDGYTDQADLDAVLIGWGSEDPLPDPVLGYVNIDVIGQEELDAVLFGWGGDVWSEVDPTLPLPE